MSQNLHLFETFFFWRKVNFPWSFTRTNLIWQMESGDIISRDWRPRIQNIQLVFINCFKNPENQTTIFRLLKMKIFGHVWPWPNFRPCLTLFLILKSRSHWMNESIPNPSYPDKNILKPIILRLCEPHRPSWMSLRTLTVWLGIKGERPFFGVFDYVINSHFEFESKVLHYLKLHSFGNVLKKFHSIWWRSEGMVETMCSSGCHHKVFVATHTLGHTIYGHILLIPAAKPLWW